MKLIIIKLLAALSVFSVVACSSTESSSSAKKSSSSSSSTEYVGGTKSEDKDIAKLEDDYKKATLSFLDAKIEALKSVNRNDDANKLKISRDTLFNDKMAGIESMTSTMKIASNIKQDIKTQTKLKDAEAKKHFISSLKHFGTGLAEEILLAQTIKGVVDNAKNTIASASFMAKAGLISKFEPLMSLAKRIPNDLDLAQKTLGDYITYGIENGISKEELKAALPANLQNL